jgi:glycosyltransferase involved in cell wall biosynthesis
LEFSVLISIFSGAVPEEFSRALSSIWERQTKKPSEIVLIIDGPIPKTLEQVVSKKKEEIGSALSLVFLPDNLGLGEALRIGVTKCRFDWIARMDADDVSDSERFEKQISVIESVPDLDIIGSYVQERSNAASTPAKLRRCPISHKDIVRYAKKRCPFNHPTVMFKKEAIIRAGNYLGYRNYQDYELWVRLIQSGAKCLNIAEPLVTMKVDQDLIGRRGGLRYACLEYNIQQKFLTTRFLSKVEFFRNVTIRISVRLLPRSIRRWFYSSVLRRR